METASTSWPNHLAITDDCVYRSEDSPTDQKRDRRRDRIEPWLTGLLQSEHINLLVGNGLTTALTRLAGTSGAGMGPAKFKASYAEAVNSAAEDRARHRGRTRFNIEDQINAANDLIAGFEIVCRTDDDAKRRRATELCSAWTTELNQLLKGFVTEILRVERDFDGTLSARTKAAGSGSDADADATAGESGASVVRRTLDAFLLPLVHRSGSRDRCHLFTTNYDRFLEYGCDLLGLSILDRFVGTLTPIFRSSRLDLDMHYDPPGIRGEPRYLEGVVRLTKLHGSLDWRHAPGSSGRREVRRCALPFGADSKHPDASAATRDSLLIYPNAAKDVETTNYPYADLFRDFAAALCRPNTVLVTYGYGFGDAHVNRVLRDMLTIPSTHIVIIAYGDGDGSVTDFYGSATPKTQLTLLYGNHFGDLRTLVDFYWPKPSSHAELLRVSEEIRGRSSVKEDGEPSDDECGDGSSDRATLQDVGMTG